VINAKLEDAIAVGPHVVNVSKASGNERSGDERKQGSGANAASLGFSAFEFLGVECHRYSFLDDAN
jgi:hypothetical protein